MFEGGKPIYSQEHQQFIIQYFLQQQYQLTDYMQVFVFYTENNQQLLKQKQEVKHRETTIFVRVVECKPIERTVWAMDQGRGGIIIMFPEDY